MNPKPKYVSFTSVNRTLDDALNIYKQRINDAVDVYSKFNEDFEPRLCPVCGGNENEEIDKFHRSYGVVKCNHCASVFVNPCPTLEALEYYYNECSCNEMLGNVYRKRATSNNPIVSDRAIYIIDIIEKLLSSRKSNQAIKILEVGCSSGVFLAELKHGLAIKKLLDKCDLQGVDIDQNAVNKSVDPELDLIAMPVEKFSESNSSEFDLVVHFELIEHLSDPFQFMVSINKLLKPSGIHHFHTPNALGMDNVALGWNYTRLLAHGIFPPMHINAFTTQNIVHFALRSGFNVVSVDTPGKLDVDIVRLIDEELSDDSPFTAIKDFTEEQLAIIQSWLQFLNASSHMRVNLQKA
jgi:2-polyprenyl-3-methyl-5-hydroxy-6-metoxy-1,4-benzoquinol methylase